MNRRRVLVAIMMPRSRLTLAACGSSSKGASRRRRFDQHVERADRARRRVEGARPGRHGRPRSSSGSRSSTSSASSSSSTSIAPEPAGDLPGVHRRHEQEGRHQRAQDRPRLQHRVPAHARRAICSCRSAPHFTDDDKVFAVIGNLSDAAQDGRSSTLHRQEAQDAGHHLPGDAGDDRTRCHRACSSSRARRPSVRRPCSSSC